MNPVDDSSKGVPLPLNREINRLCDEFENQLARGETPDLEAYLDRVPPEGRQPLLEELVAIACEHAGAAGEEDPAATVIARHPRLAEEIRSVVGAMSVEATAFYEPPEAPAGRSPLTPRRRRSRGLHLRCPHCSNHVELVGDTPLDSVDCTACGSNFSLVDRSKETRMAEALQKIDRFELISRLGVGGFGTVWKARDTDLDRAVAVKIPRHGQLSSEEMEQFFREARSVAQLRHPNIVPVHEVGREGDAVFIVSDLIRGVSLADLLTGKSFAPKEATELAITVADALDHAHKRGVIHRDMKPSNIMIDDAGTPFLMDFGLAKREADEVTMTIDGQIIGTPAYMSPEQADGRSAWADRRTDVYSFGVILLELLTGELPFRGNAQMQVRTRLTDDAPNSRSLNRHLPIDLATICAKCLEREPGRRYQTAAEVSAELRRFLAKEPILARPLSPIRRAARWVERSPLKAALAGLVLTLAVGGPVVAFIIERQRGQLSRKYDENANLMIAREQQSLEAMAAVNDLQGRLDLWEGRANPWAIWPPDPQKPPRRRQLASLLAARGDALAATATSDGRPEGRLLRTLAGRRQQREGRVGGEQDGHNPHRAFSTPRGEPSQPIRRVVD